MNKKQLLKPSIIMLPLRILPTNCLRQTVLVLLFAGFSGIAWPESKISEDTQGKGKNDIPLIIIDSDFGSSTDDLFALEMAIRYDQQNKCRLIGCINDRMEAGKASMADVILTYFGMSDVPVGQERNGADSASVFINYTPVSFNKNSDGTPMFARSIADYSTLPEGWKLYRSLLNSAPNKSVSICLLGFPHTLVHLLKSEPDSYSPMSGMELVKKKVKGIYIMGGHFTADNQTIGYNFNNGIDCSRTFFNLWPKEVSMFFSPSETGNNIDYAPEQVVSDISWTDRHPIKQVYMNIDCNTGQRMWDVLPLIQAVEGDKIFKLSERGNVSISSSDKMTFTPDPNGNCRYQVPCDEKWNNSIIEKIRKNNMMR